MKKIILLLIPLTLVGCQANTQNNLPPVGTQVELQETEAPIPKVEKIVVEEWFDYGCHYCEKSHEIIKNLKEKYGERLEIQERHFPLSAQTFVFAEASECARTQGKFAEFHDQVFTNFYGQFTVGNINKAAAAAEVPDIDTFNTCVSSGAEKDKVTADIQAAERIGVTGTPFFRINDELNIPGAISEQSFERLFDQLLANQ